MNGAKMVADAINAGKLPAPYNTKGFGGATATIEAIDEGGGATKQVAEYRNLVEKRGLMLLSVTFHQATVKLLRQSQRN